MVFCIEVVASYFRYRHSQQQVVEAVIQLRLENMAGGCQSERVGPISRSRGGGGGGTATVKV
jgi:hypothetical protein